jgi:hypothetical protein
MGVGVSAAGSGSSFSFSGRPRRRGAWSASCGGTGRRTRGTGASGCTTISGSGAEGSQTMRLGRIRRGSTASPVIDAGMAFCSKSDAKEERWAREVLAFPRGLRRLGWNGASAGRGAIFDFDGKRPPCLFTQHVLSIGDYRAGLSVPLEHSAALDEGWSDLSIWTCRRLRQG